jgi:hypothetical protein
VPTEGNRGSRVKLSLPLTAFNGEAIESPQQTAGASQGDGQPNPFFSVPSVCFLLFKILLL